MKFGFGVNHGCCHNHTYYSRWTPGFRELYLGIFTGYFRMGRSLMVLHVEMMLQAKERCVRNIFSESVLYRTEEYHIDGFRFDLMGLLDVDLMNRIRSELDQRYGKGKKIIYGEPWAADQSA